MGISRASVGVGINQTWQDVTGSRAAGTTYTNTTGRPIQVSVRASSSNTGVSITLTVGGVVVDLYNSANANALQQTVGAIVPSGATYSVTLNSMAITSWMELR